MLEQILHFISDHALWAGPIAGLLCFGESLAIIGLLIPATSAMLAIGGLVGAGILPPFPLFAWAVAGAILGDWVSYEWGRKIGPSLYRKPPFNRYRRIMARTRLLFRKYGAVGVFLGRFSGPVRATVPLVAGSLGLSRGAFQIANVASGVIWVPLMLGPGYLAAHHWGAIWHDPTIRMMVIGVLGVLAFAAVIYALYRMKGRT